MSEYINLYFVLKTWSQLTDQQYILLYRVLYEFL